MRFNREESLRVLESVSPGLAAKEIIEQSDCLVFTGGKVCTFNDEIFCSNKSPWKGIEGAIKARPVLDLLSKLPEDEIDVEQKEGEILIKGKRRMSGIRMEQDIVLPVESVEDPDEWQELSGDFTEAVDIVHSCASTLESEFIYTCIHVHPEYLEATDRYQIARYRLDTGLGKPLLVRATSLRTITGLGMTALSQSGSWIHFKSNSGLVLSIRKYLEDYDDLDKFLGSSGMEPMVIPTGIEDVVSKAEIFSSDNALGNSIQVTLQPERMIIEGQGASGWYKEAKSVKYSGDPVKFNISPKLLVELSKKANECKVGGGKMLVDTGKFKYATCLSVPTEE